MESDKNTEEAFRWIVGILKKHNISFQITGGFAAQIYGAKRPLLDIDGDTDYFTRIILAKHDAFVFAHWPYKSHM